MAKWTERNIPDQTGRTILVTGANSGLGLRTARVLAEKGARVLLGCRSRERAATALEIPGTEFLELDLGDLSSVRAAAEQISTVDVLINNAGIMAVPHGRTKDGFERQFGTNHLGHAALTWLLMPVLRRTPGSRVVTVASLAHRQGRIDFDDPNFERRRYNPAAAYSQSKLANILFARELDRRSPDVTSLAAHPGVTKTDLTDNMAASYNSVLLKLGGRISHLFSQSVEHGALPQLYAATALEARGGHYYGPDGPGGWFGNPADAPWSPQAGDDLAAAKLWDLTAKLTGVTPDPA